MLEAIKELGEGILKKEGKRFIYNIIKDVRKSKEEEENLILILNFKLEENVIKIFYNKEIDKDILRNYLWVGNASGNNPQDRLTTDNPEYLITNSIPNLYESLENNELKNKLKEIIDKFFIKIDNKFYILDLSKIENSKYDKDEIINSYKIINDHDKFTKLIFDKFFEIIKQNSIGIKKKNILLYSIEIDNKKPSEFNEYLDYVENKFINEPFLEGDSFEGICHVCGKKTIVTSNTTNLIDKYYITKLIIFASDLDKKNFKKNFSLCEDCYTHLIVGSNVLKSKLNFYLAGNTVYLIPSFIFKLKDESAAYDFIDYTKYDLNSILTIDDFLNFEESIKKDLEKYKKYLDSKNYINFNLLFYDKDQASFKIKKLIKDIPSKRRDEIYNAIDKINIVGEKIFGKEKNRWILTLNQIYYLFPVSLDDKNRAVDNKKILDFYESLFLGKKIKLDFLIRNFVDLIKVYRFKKFYKLTQIRKPNNIDIEMIYSVLKTNLLIKMLRILNILNGGEKMIENLENLPLKDDFKNYFLEMNFSEEEAALFLLGYLIAEIGNQQRSTESEKKPILEKINFHGMNPKKIIILINEVFEKLDQYKVRHFNEINFSVMKMLFDKNINNWRLSDIDNVYYVLSGYAFNTYKLISYGKKEVKNE